MSDDDEPYGSSATTRLELIARDMREVKSDVKAISARVTHLYEEGVLRRLVELEMWKDSQGKERRTNYAQAGFIIFGIALGVAASYLKAPR